MSRRVETLLPAADAAEIERSALSSVHARLEETAGARLEFLRDLVRIDSATGREAAVQRRLAAVLGASGVKVDVLEIDEEAAKSLVAPGSGAVAIGGPNVLGTLLGSGGGRSLLIAGHCDTVPVGGSGGWSVAPLGGEMRDGCVWGRGACDMKAGLAAAVCAVVAVAESGLRVRGDVAVLSTIGEEAGCPGSLSFAATGATYDACIVPEPTRLAIAPAHGGFVHLTVTLRGKGAHASMRDAGVSVVDKFSLLVNVLREFERERNEQVGSGPGSLYDSVVNKVPVNIGIVHGGESSASVAEELVCSVRLGVLAEEDMVSVCSRFEEWLAAWADGDAWLRDHRPVVTWTGPQVPGASIPPNSPIVATLRDSVVAAAGVEPQLTGMTYGSDMVNLVRAGISSVLFGPGDPADIHCVDEHVSIREYDVATHVLAEMIVRWCGVDGEQGRPPSDKSTGEPQL